MIRSNPTFYKAVIDRTGCMRKNGLHRWNRFYSEVTQTQSTNDAGVPSSIKPLSSAKRMPLKSKRAVITLTPSAVARLQELQTNSQSLLRISVRNKGCAGMSYHLDYVPNDQTNKFDERVTQDGVNVLIDSKALFSIIGSEMDFIEDRLSEKFVFKNPNVKEECGCGESFSLDKD